MEGGVQVDAEEGFSRGLCGGRSICGLELRGMH